MSPDYPVLIFVALAALLWAAHRIDRWVSRRRARAHRAYLRATLLDSLRRDLARAEAERDEATELTASLESLNAALWRANDDLVNKLEQRMTDEERAELQRGLTIYDRLVTGVMDRATWGGGE